MVSLIAESWFVQRHLTNYFYFTIKDEPKMYFKKKYSVFPETSFTFVNYGECLPHIVPG